MAGPLDDLLASQYGSLFQSPQQTAPLQLQPEQRESILRSLANLGTSGLQALGYVLDLPGRPVRSALAGHWGDVLPSFIDSSRAPTGEDLAKQWGLLEGEGTKGKFELRDLVGPALEIATNPTTFINPAAPLVGGALSEAGQTAKLAGRLAKPIGATTADLATAAQATGKLAPTLASRIAAGQGGLFDLGIPGMKSLQTTLGTGDTAQAIAEGIGKAQGYLGQTAPARYAKSLFQNVYENTSSKFLQPVLKYGSELADPLVAEGKATVADLARTLGHDLGASEVPLYQAANPHLPPGLLNTPHDILYGINEGTIAPLPNSALAKVGQTFEQLGRDLPGKEQAKGVSSILDALTNPTGADLGNYAPSSVNPIHLNDPGFKQAGVRPQLPIQGAQNAREVPRDIMVGKRLGVNAASIDPDIAGLVRSGKGSVTDVERALVQKGYVTGNVDPKDLTKMADILGSLSPEAVANKIPYYNTDYLEEWTKRLASSGRVQGRAEAMLDGLKRVAKPAGSWGPSSSVPLGDMLEKLGFAPQAINKVGPGLHVPAEVAQDLSRYVEAFTRPESVSPLLKGYDAFTNLFKVGVSTIFPASRIRDLWQNVFMNFVKGNRDTRYSALNPLSYYRPYEDATNTFLRGGVVQDAHTIPEVIKALGPNATPEQATKFVADRAYAYGLIDPHESAAALQKGGMSPAAKGFVLPGEKPPSILGAATEPGLTWNPLAVSKVGENVETTNRLAVMGNRAITKIDHLGRGAAFYAQLRQGATFEEAARAATEAMYDYGNLSRFERSVMQRAIPFYSFMRQNMPAQLEELVKNPGGALANSVRVTNSLRRDQGFVPENVGEGLALPIGTDESSGRTKYLTHFGLPFEEATGPLTGSVAGTLRNLIGESHPLIKGPVELAANRSMYTGKPLQADEGLLANTAFAPLERIARTAKTLANPSAAGAMELVSPFKVREANVEGAQRAAARESIQELLGGNPAVRQFTNLSVKPEDLPNLSPRDRLLLQLYQSMQQRNQPAGASR